ncbi:5-deoxy-glucuronate isomerase [Nocardiopsis ganjiahuensis]|uniref:5-deoxy-glucuronate isomerase n=1 Tax=Nocardiopsis ganjiahuensis TaxID=239984 RepID=UPI00034C30F2|nr:5-deoxy-glucuronate isomerase [Nocardiopsis ganjiahuensis]
MTHTEHRPNEHGPAARRPAELHLSALSTAQPPFRTVVTPDTAGWGYSGLRVLELEPGHSAEITTGDSETLVLPLDGGCTVTLSESSGAGSGSFRVEGRPDVFSRVSDFVYLPRGARATVASASGGRFALPAARCDRTLPARYGPAEDVPVELRGAGQSSRQVNNLCLPGTFAADRLLVCEVLTPAANWSSYPPHKHDEATATECELEEIYYFEVADGPHGHGVGYHRVHGTPGRPVEVLAEVRREDVVLVPHGWHGPSMAAPGYDLYYLNVMAGPGDERAWRISDHPDHAWVRGTWEDQETDPRLPLCTAEGRKGRR